LLFHTERDISKFMNISIKNFAWKLLIWQLC